MAIVFRESDHSYTSTGDENIPWLSATGVKKLFQIPFDDNQAEKSSKNINSKWYGKDPIFIQQKWDDNTKRATDLGHKYHKQQEELLINNSKPGLSVVPACKKEGGLIYAPDQRLQNNTIYPEHLCYLKSAALCGQADEVEVVNNYVNIGDHKTSEKIEKNSFMIWDKVDKCRRPKMMTGVLSHLEDCNFNHYALQLSLYMYMCLKHNFNYSAGTLTVHHVLFEEDGVDEWGYRIVKVDSLGEPIVKGVEDYALPYLKTEVIAVINYLKERRLELRIAA